MTHYEVRKDCGVWRKIFFPPENSSCSPCLRGEQKSLGDRMTELAYTDFRGFVEEAKRISDYRIIEGADWDAEIGALVESTAELVPQPPMLIFDKVKGYPAGYRVCSLPYAAYRRVALALGFPTDKTKLEILRMAARKMKRAEPIAAEAVAT